MTKLENAIQSILECLRDEYGLKIDDPNFIETPQRVARAYAEIFAGVANTDKQVDAILKTAFPSTYAGMIVQRGIRVYSMCPHHLLQIAYSVDLAYIPRVGGGVLGLSKLSRIVSILAKRPVMQEQFTDDIVNALERLQSCEGAAVRVNGIHSCMSIRGAKQSDVITTTSSLRGVFRTDATARNEWTALIK